MRKIVRIGTVAGHDQHRREDVLRMPPSDRVRLVLEQQCRVYGWNRRPIVRVATVRRLGGHADVAPPA
jgi:hypothetical protein